MTLSVIRATALFIILCLNIVPYTLSTALSDELYSFPKRNSWELENKKSYLNTTCSSSSDCKKGLVCKEGTCKNCENNQDCKSSQVACIEDAQLGNICQHKPLLPNVTERDIALTFLSFFGGAIAAGGGVGGGGVFVPLLILVGGFNPKEAVSLSNALIGGAAIANFVQMLPTRHPYADRPLIEYNLALFIQPLSLGGTMIGVIFNRLFPSWLLLALLISMLLFTFNRTAKKGYQLWKKESQTHHSNIQEQEEEPLVSLNSDASNKPLSSILQSESKTPKIILLLLFLILSGVTIVSLLKGSSKGPSIVGVQPCSTGYWLLTLLAFPPLIMFTVAYGWYLIRRDYLKRDLCYPFKLGDIRWSPKVTLKIGSVSFLSGVLASLLGIGGGMIISPVMLELGVLPEVTAATSSFMILFTSLSSTAQFLVAGTLQYDYAVWFSIVGLISSFVGQTLLNHLVKKYKKKSYIIFAISIIIVGSTILLGITGIIDVVKNIKQKQSMGFQSLCN